MAAEDRRPFNCNRCTWGRHCDESKPAPFKQWHFMHNGETVFHSRTCPLPLVQPWAHKMLMLFQHYRQGRYPFSGGLLEQPNFYIEAMAVIEGVTAEIEAGRVARSRGEAQP